MIDYPAGYSDLDVIRQALALQQQAAPQQPMAFPQATPAQQYYGPAHQALSQLFQQSMLQQAQPGLLTQPTAQQMGLLSTDMPAFTAVPLPIGGDGTLGANEYYRIMPDYWQNVKMDPKTGKVTDARNAPTTTPANQYAPRTGSQNTRS
jgi:hypothetical protein